MFTIIGVQLLCDILSQIFNFFSHLELYSIDNDKITMTLNIYKTHDWRSIYWRVYIGGVIGRSVPRQRAWSRNTDVCDLGLQRTR